MKTATIQSILALLTLVLGAQIELNAQMPNYPIVPEKAEFVYSDLQNFVLAFDQIGPKSDTLKILNSMYFDKGSPGLNEFVQRHQLTAELLRDAIRKDPKTYQRIPEFISSLEDFKPKFKQAMLDYDSKMPNVMYPPTYLLVGAKRGIGQASKYGQLITITRIMDDQETLLTMIVHELSHFQQVKEMGYQNYVSLYSEPNNMLGLCMREGSAEFFTHLALGRITQEKSLTYLLKNEPDLKDKFLADLKNEDPGYWLWESVNQKDHPQLLGYAMGYQISRSFYHNSPDKDVALKQLLSMTDPGEMMKKSEYFSGGGTE